MHPIFLHAFFLFCQLIIFVHLYNYEPMYVIFVFVDGCFLYMMHLLYTNMYVCMLYFSSIDHLKPYANHYYPKAIGRECQGTITGTQLTLQI